MVRIANLSRSFPPSSRQTGIESFRVNFSDYHDAKLSLYSTAIREIEKDVLWCKVKNRAVGAHFRLGIEFCIE
jgi:hypothetical protein